MRKYAILGAALVLSIAGGAKADQQVLGDTVVASPEGATPDAAKAGWQASYSYTVPPGTTSLFFHYPCPKQYPVVWNGAFAFSPKNNNQTQEVYLQYNGPRQDETPESYGEWGWHFYWPSGSPNPTHIWFQPFCQKSE